MAEIRVQRERRSAGWLWVILALIAIAALFFFAFPDREDRTATQPAPAARSGAAPGTAPNPAGPDAPPAR